MKVRITWSKAVGKIPPIRLHRYLTGQGLKESKDFIESVTTWPDLEKVTDVYVSNFTYEVKTNRSLYEIQNQLNEKDRLAICVEPIPISNSIVIDINATNETATVKVTSENITADMNILLCDLPAVVEFFTARFEREN